MNSHKNLRKVMIIQARMGATRLPGKPMKNVLNRPLLSYLIERVTRTKKIDQVVVATTTNPKDDEIFCYCQKHGVACIRGSENDVLDRYLQAAQAYAADVIVRITADCPLIDPDVIDEVVSYYLDNQPKFDYVANTITRTYPRGMDVEVFSRQALEEAAVKAIASEDREHVTPYLYRHPQKFKIGSVVKEKDDSRYRWTVDTVEDFTLISKILEEIYPKKPGFSLKDLLNLLEAHPEWSKINADIKQKELPEAYDTKL